MSQFLECELEAQNNIFHLLKHYPSFQFFSKKSPLSLLGLDIFQIFMTQCIIYSALGFIIESLGGSNFY